MSIEFILQWLFPKHIQAIKEIFPVSGERNNVIDLPHATAETPSLVGLNPLLQLNIAQFLDNHTKLALRRTCHRMRDVVNINKQDMLAKQATQLQAKMETKLISQEQALSEFAELVAACEKHLLFKDGYSKVIKELLRPANDKFINICVDTLSNTIECFSRKLESVQFDNTSLKDKLSIISSTLIDMVKQQAPRPQLRVP